MRLAGIAAIATLAVLAGAAGASAGTYFKPLVVGTTSSTGQGVGTSVTLSLRTDQFQVIRRPSRHSLTVGYPKTTVVHRHGKPVTVRAKPCAITTIRLSLAAGQADPLALVRAAEPDALEEGNWRYPIDGASDLTDPPRGAWRITSSIVNSSLLQEHGTSVEQLFPSDPFGPTVAALRTLTMSGHMLYTGGRCGGTNSFTLGPGVHSVTTFG